MSLTAATLIGWTVVNATAVGYQAPSVTVSSSLPKRAQADAVLIVPVVSSDDGAKVLAADAYLDSDAVASIEDSLKALGASGAAEQVNRVVVPSRRWSGGKITRQGKVRGDDAVGAGPWRDGRRADPGCLQVQRLPQRQDRAEGAGPA
jgi:hypothetical protein